jgi:LacI family transcriptional regulator
MAVAQNAKKMSAKRQVYVILGAERQYHREVWAGIARYARVHGGWLFRGEPTLLGAGGPLTAGPRPDGVIAMVRTAGQLDSLRRLGAPLVSVSIALPDEEIHRVVSDEAAMARAAVEHFRQRGFEHFAFCELDNLSHLRGRHFAEALGQAGFSCQVFRVGYSRRRHWTDGRDRAALGAWLASLPRPVAILAHNDIRARHLVETCAAIGLSVPDDVAVLGIDNEPPFCEVCQPPLSTIVPNAERVGFEAGALLEKLIAGEPAKRCVLIPPQGIVVRQSTDVTAVRDPLVANAVQFIREHACEGIDVADVLTHAVVSRTWLDQRFRQFLGRTPHEEILRVRLNRACQLLQASDLALDVVAQRSGFRHAAYLVEVFAREIGQTPGQYRHGKESK